MTEQDSDKITIGLRSISLKLGAMTAILVLVTSSFGMVWTHFLKYKVDEQIDGKTEKIILENKATREMVLEIRQYLRIKDPKGWRQAIEFERQIKGNGFQE